MNNSDPRAEILRIVRLFVSGELESPEARGALRYWIQEFDERATKRGEFVSKSSNEEAPVSAPTFDLSQLSGELCGGGPLGEFLKKMKR